MHSSVLSIRAFGVYAIVTGLWLLIAPAILLSAFGIAPPAESWVRVLGALAIVVG